MGRGALAGSLGGATARWTETSSQRENDTRPLPEAGAEHCRVFGCRGVKQLPGGVGHGAGLKPCLLLQVRGMLIPDAEGGTAKRDDDVNFLKGHEAALLGKKQAFNPKLRVVHASVPAHLRSGPASDRTPRPALGAASRAGPPQPNSAHVPLLLRTLQGPQLTWNQSPDNGLLLSVLPSFPPSSSPGPPGHAEQHGELWAWPRWASGPVPSPRSLQVSAQRQVH
ncbi:uncharacterized protein [Physeter macrocephalus]|uniref:Uncharacterized protein n=1 Tax=Physeter macrocephalus TaxID=9755 RepID=A0A455B3Y0_PHYMC|nr:uncharacterized protein LOC114485946 [Physeter catodon]|eukprot:XP_028343645.1 uncharacterized protein LOC114485946 [Physeter catodon]